MIIQWSTISTLIYNGTSIIWEILSGILKGCKRFIACLYMCFISHIECFDANFMLKK